MRLSFFTSLSRAASSSALMLFSLAFALQAGDARILADALQRDAQNLVALVLHLGQAGKSEAMHVTQGLVDRNQLADGDQGTAETFVRQVHQRHGEELALLFDQHSDGVVEGLDARNG